MDESHLYLCRDTAPACTGRPRGDRLCGASLRVCGDTTPVHSDQLTMLRASISSTPVALCLNLTFFWYFFMIGPPRPNLKVRKPWNRWPPPVISE